MAIQRLSMKDVTVLKNPGKCSEQLVWPENAPDARATITRVTMEPGSVSKRHAHAHSEIWLVERGSGRLLLRDGMQSELGAGDIILTPPGETRGVESTANEPLVYLAITTRKISRRPMPRKLPDKAPEALSQQFPARRHGGPSASAIACKIFKASAVPPASPFSKSRSVCPIVLVTCARHRTAMPRWRAKV